MAAAVKRSHDRQGLAAVVLEELTRRAVEDGLIARRRPAATHLEAPLPDVLDGRVRHLDPRGRPLGRPVDPHPPADGRAGARTPPRRSMVIEGSVAEWEAWADMAFPVTGDFVVPDALGPVHVDRERDRAVYVEENLWVQYR